MTINTKSKIVEILDIPESDQISTELVFGTDIIHFRLYAGSDRWTRSCICDNTCYGEEFAEAWALATRSLADDVVEKYTATNL